VFTVFVFFLIIIIYSIRSISISNSTTSAGVPTKNEGRKCYFKS